MQCIRIDEGFAQHSVDLPSNAGRLFGAPLGPARGTHETREVWKALGTTMELRLRHPLRKTMTQAIRGAMGEVQRIEDVMSVYRPNSQLSRLNRDGHLARPDPYLLQVLQTADLLHRETRGAFDITVQRLWLLHREAHAAGRRPQAAALALARERTGQWQLRHSTDGVDLVEGAQITLNGIAQGFAVDCVLRCLRRHGIQHALVDLGELAGIGSSESGDPWKAGIQHPRVDDAFLALAPLEDRCLATSGDYATSFTSDFAAHHIFDPRTGLSPTELASVSVFAPSAIEADGISTALMTLGIERGVAYLLQKRDVDALFVTKDGRMTKTAGFPTGSVG